MSHIPLPDNAGRVDTFMRNEGSDTVHMQAVVPVDPATGSPLPLAQETTLVALSSAVVTLNAAASAIQSAVEAINSKTTLVNTGAVSGTVALDAPTLSALESISAETGLAQPLTNSELRASPLPVVPQGYDAGDDMIKVKSVQKKFRDSFVGAALNAAKWDSSIGTGGAVTTGSGLLTMGSGTTASAQTSIITKETFTVPFRVNIGLTLSQRIANQTFIVEAVSVDPLTGIPDGLHCVALLWDGTTATQAKYRVQNSGATPLDSSASTFPTSASGGFYELEPFADEAWFHGGTLDATTGRANSYRRHQQIPEPNAVFKVRLRWLNGGTAPASNTNAVIQYISVQDYAELTAEITAGRGQTVAGQAIGVAVCSMPTTTVSGTVTANEGTPVTPTASILNSAATTNGTVVKASAGTIYGVVLANNGATDAWFKLHNSTTVTVGTTAVAMWIKVPAGSNVNLQFGSKGLRHGTGICYSITGAVADTDATAVAAGQVKVNLSYV